MADPFPWLDKPAEGLGENLKEKLNPLEVLSLPSLMVSEGYGKYQETQDPAAALGASLRAFYRGTDEREFGTMGEQLMPVEQGETFGRKAARFGVDVATDPLILFPGTAGTKVLKASVLPYTAAYKGARMLPGVGNAIKAGERGGRALLNSKAAAKFEEWVLPMESYVARRGGAPGVAWRDGMRHMLEEADLEAAPYMEQLAGSMKAAGFGAMRGMLPGKSAKRELIAKSLEAGVPMGPVGQTARTILDDIGGKAARYVDKEGNPFQVFDAVTGKYAPFVMRENYVPQRFTQEFTEQLMSKTPEDAAKLLRLKLNIGADEAQKLLSTIKKAGNIEFARTMKIPDEIREWDIGKLMNGYINQWSKRAAFGKQWGLDGKALKDIAEASVKAGKGMTEKYALGVSDLLMNPDKFSSFGLDKLANGIMAYQVISKMGPSSTIAQLSQQANTFVTEGGVAFLKGIFKGFGTEEGRRLGMRAYARGHKNAMRQLFGGHQGWATNAYLTGTGFNLGEIANRVGAGNAGIATVERMLRESGGELTKDLMRYGVNRNTMKGLRALKRLPDIEDRAILERMGLSADEALDASRASTRIALRTANKTQHANRITDLPLWAQTPEARVFLQYKNFIYQQSRFIYNEVAVPAARFYATGGREGSIAPLYRAAAGFGLSGTAVAEAREFLKENAAALMDVKHKKRKVNTKHPGWQVLKDMGYVGAWGMAGDIMSASSQGRGLDWLAGPTLSDISRGMQGATTAAYDFAIEGETPDSEDVVAEIYRKTLRGLIPVQPQAVGKRWTP